MRVILLHHYLWRTKSLMATVRQPELAKDKRQPKRNRANRSGSINCTGLAMYPLSQINSHFADFLGCQTFEAEGRGGRGGVGGLAHVSFLLPASLVPLACDTC